MKILLTGATGYIGKRILPVLVNQGHQVVCCVRDMKRFTPIASLKSKIEIIEVDLLNPHSLNNIPLDIDCAFYLVHSMSAAKNYAELEIKSARNFTNAINNTKAKQVIYLSGIINDKNLSPHLQSRKNVELELGKGKFALTTFRAGIIIGSGSASFEIIRDLVEKLPIMVAPKWLKTKCQPIAITDVIKILSQSVDNESVYDKSFDIGGPEVLSYKEMLLQFAAVRYLKRTIISIPVMTPRLSSYWLYFVTTTTYKLASALVDSMKVEVIAKDSNINSIIGIKPLSYKTAIKKAFIRIEQNEIISSWKDAIVNGTLEFKVSDFINIPTFGCFVDKRERASANISNTIDKVWKIGGNTGWYHANWLWKIRGFMDLLSGGVGLRRGRTNQDEIYVGDALDFWRVIYADKEEGRLLLFAEMKLPGEAWLEFNANENTLIQTATFRPNGLWGRVYWFAVYPFHGIIFKGLLNKLVS
ncbi:SDR family oxidoreductase [Saccharicrinis aurantiacus]|uniref:SDR family oxidoreductase n=1 Tax=Saccharicrinis aurantiacus TaxID=1849719 RepID=UPI0008395FD6|nr:SDR family oxidoreductase [Saccharicrinis aurantiacus]